MDWAELNPDLVRLIAKKVGDISNFIRFRAVCKHWRLAVPPSDLPQQLPYFIQCKRKSDSSFNIQFGSLFAKKTHMLPIQISQLKGEPLLFGSLTGFVLLRFFESSTWLLLNPLTGFQVPLPFGIDNCFRPIYFGPSCSPNSVENEIDVVFEFAEKETKDCIVRLWRYADRKWTKITEVLCSSDEYIKYTNGRLYAFSIEDGDAKVIDSTTGDVVSLIPGSSMDIHYLTEAYGNLLGVQHRHKSFNLISPSRESIIDVYRLEGAGTNPHWVKVNDIGDQMLFFDYDGNCLCLKASGFEGCRGNSVYLMDLAIYNYSACCYFLRYDMKSETQVELYPDEYRRKWFVPSLI